MYKKPRERRQDTREMLHVAQVSKISAETGSSRVAFDDMDNMVSNDYQHIYPSMGKWRMHFIPQEGDHVAVLQPPNGKQEGLVLGTVFTAANLPPKAAGAGKVMIYSVNGENHIVLDAEGNLKLEFKETVKEKFKNQEIEAEEGVKQKSKTLEIEAETITIKANSVTIEAPAIELKGDVKIDGDLKVTGDIKNDGDMKTEGVHTDSIGKHS